MRHISRWPLLGIFVGIIGLTIPPWTWRTQLIGSGLALINFLFLWIEIKEVENVESR